MNGDATPDGPRVARQPDGDEWRKAARASFWRRIAVAAGVSAVVLLLAFSAWTLYLIRDVQLQNRPTLHNASAAAAQAKRATERIEDCTTPGGVCFERAKRQTSGAVAGINTITVRATACLAVVLKSIPDGSSVVVDEVASRIQQCIQSSTTSVKPRKVTPAPKRATPTPAPKGPAAHPGASPKPSPRPASPVPTGTTPPSPGTTGNPLADLTCQLAPTLCP